MSYPIYPHFVNECVRQPFAWPSPIAGVLVILLIWSLVWKGLALWKAARSNHNWWFVALLIVNTLGLLEILYIYVFSTWGKKNASGSLSGTSM